MFFRKYNDAREYAKNAVHTGLTPYAWICYSGTSYRVQFGGDPALQPPGSYEVRKETRTVAERLDSMRQYLNTLAPAKAGK